MSRKRSPVVIVMPPAFVLPIEFGQHAGNAPCFEKGVELAYHLACAFDRGAVRRERGAVVCGSTMQRGWPALQ